VPSLKGGENPIVDLAVLSPTSLFEAPAKRIHLQSGTRGHEGLMEKLKAVYRHLRAGLCRLLLLIPLMTFSCQALSSVPG
jgi:hypothetical protein